MSEPILKIYMDEEDDNRCSVIFREDVTDVVRQLGILEWAKSAILETISSNNALSAYNDEDEDE